VTSRTPARTVLAATRTAVTGSPATALALVLLLAVGLASGALWSGPRADRLTDSFGYGVPAFADGRWWTVLTGAGLAVSPWGYLPVLLGLAVLGRTAERRLGTVRTLGALAVCHVVGVVAAAVLVDQAPDGWDRLGGLLAVTDAGPSAGFLGAAAAATAQFGPPWRSRWRVGLVGYVVASVVLFTGLADLEHAFAVAAGLVAGPLLCGRLPVRAANHLQAAAGHADLVARWQRAEAAATLLRHGAIGRLAWMTTWRGNTWFRHPSHVGYVAHRRLAGVALGLGDPVAASPGDRAELLAEFARGARADRLVPCLFAAGEETRQAAHRLGWRSVRVADEAVIDLSVLAFCGKAWQDVRTALNRAERDGITLWLGRLTDAPAALRSQVESLSADWVAGKRLPELGFTLGGVAEALDTGVRVALAVDAEGGLHGVTSWLPVHRPGDGQQIGWTLDVMRRREDGFRGVMEFLIARACLAFRDEGAEVVSLSACPLAHAGAVGDGRLGAWLDRLGAALEPCYGFRSLHAFKAKFQPRLEPLYLLYPSTWNLPRIGMALADAYLPAAGPGVLTRLVRKGHI
jgi:membrane associated rhomboid family serine protease